MRDHVAYRVRPPTGNRYLRLALLSSLGSEARRGSLLKRREKCFLGREPFAPLRTKLASMGTLSSVSGAEDRREMSWVQKRLKKALDNTEVTVES